MNRSRVRSSTKKVKRSGPLQPRVTGVVSQGKLDAYFEWAIPNILSPDIVENHFDSPAFSFSGHFWFLRLHLNALSTDNSQWMSLFLFRGEPQNSLINVVITCGIKKTDDTLEEKKPISHLFNGNQSMVNGTPMSGIFATNGYTNFWLREDLIKRKLELLSSGTLTITCRLVTGASYPNQGLDDEYKLSELTSLSADFEDLFVNRTKCDTVIKVEGDEFHVHKAILIARSPVFAAMFQHDMAERKTGRMNIVDCDPYYFGDFLKYLYTGKVEGMSPKKAYHLYASAVKYQVRKLKQLCIVHIARNLTAQNLCDVVTLAHQHDDEELMSSANSFFNQNFGEIFLTSEWEDLLMRNHLLANKLLIQMASNVVKPS